MKRTIGRVLVAGMTIIAIVGAGGALSLYGVEMTTSPQDPGELASLALFAVGLSFGVVSFAVVGLLLVWRRGHRMGWVFAAVGMGLAVGFAASEHVFLATEGAGIAALPWVAWLSNWLTIPVLAGGLAALLLLFPTGALPSPRWRSLAWLAAASLGLFTLGLATQPHLQDAGRVANPLPIVLPSAMTDAMVAIGQVTYAPVLLGSLAAMAWRFRAASAPERQQLKWFMYGGAVTATGWGLLLLSLLSPSLEPISNVGWPLGIFGMISIPAAAGIAIFRYRLYDIDLIIRRTLVYGALSVALGAIYIGVVLALQAPLGPLTAGNSLAVAGSTLAMAALFRPLRTRIQRVVDRRFYRSRYDAARTLEAFSLRLRDQIDLESLTGELRSVVESTMQPASASVWVRRS